MKSASVHEIKQELSSRPPQELVDLCLRLAKFKKENKELLTYLLYEANDEQAFIESIKVEIDEAFAGINTTNYYFVKKSVRKILRLIKKYIRYSGKKETEVELKLYFCQQLSSMKPSIKNNQVLINIYQRELMTLKKSLSTLHEDLQFDYLEVVKKLEMFK